MFLTGLTQALGNRKYSRKIGWSCLKKPRWLLAIPGASFIKMTEIPFAGQHWRHRQRTDLQTRAVREEGEGDMNGERNMEAYTPPYVKSIATGNLMYHSGKSN